MLPTFAAKHGFQGTLARANAFTPTEGTRFGYSRGGYRCNRYIDDNKEVRLVPSTTDINRIEQTTMKFVEGSRGSFEALVDNAVALQEQNARFAQNWFTSTVEFWRNQAETNRRTAQALAENLRKQQEGLRGLAREGAEAYAELLGTPFGYAQRAVREGQQLAREGTEQGVRAAQEVSRIGVRAAEQTAQTGAQAAEQAAERATRNVEQQGNRAATRSASNGSEFPVENYDELTVDEVTERLDGLSAEEMKRVRTYEKRHKSRETLIEQLDRKINAASSQ
jgi:hypothetical protein